jgi:hypothetical protein
MGNYSYFIGLTGNVAKLALSKAATEEQLKAFLIDFGEEKLFLKDLRNRDLIVRYSR